ncbi:DNA gyrase [Oscillospiraceae bacterium OttesenSCG-928-F05]|nr:DNA gyrase [Oscillospiraceae bacterium OttesenSCG-928-F05]
MSIPNETRRESYHIIIASTETRRNLILGILGNREMTAHEIAEELHKRGFTPHYERNFAAPRLTELKQAGKIVAVGKRYCEKTRRNVVVWARADRVNITCYNPNV